MNAVAFDTLKFARTLRERANLTAEQAEGMADAMAEVFASGIPTKTDIADIRHDIEALRLSTQADLAGVRRDIEAMRLTTQADLAEVSRDIEALRFSTRSDIEALRPSTRSDIEALRLSTQADLATAKSDIIKWMFGMIGFQTVAILGAVVALARSLH